MATAIGAYATLSDVKSRLGITDTTDDTLLTSFVNQANMMIESYTGRILAPVPVVSTTLNGAVAAGVTSIVVASATNIVAGMRLVIGTLNSASQEAATVATSYTSGTTIPLAAPQGYTVAWTGLLNAYASGATVATAYIFDGMDVLEGGRLLPIPRGLVSLSQLRLGFFTGDTLKFIPTYDYYLRPNAQEREPGWPFTELWMTDIPTADVQVPLMQQNLEARSGFFANVELTGQLGWPAIPDDIVNIADNYAIGLYRARGAGGGDSFTIGEGGQRTFERLLSYTDRLALNRYRVKTFWAV